MPEPTDAIADRLDADRRALLDLSLRNPLLNYRPRRRSLTIVGESPAELVRILVREGKRMAFDPAPDPPPDAERPEGDEAPLELPPADPTDLNLQTDATADALQDRLLAIDSAARGSVEELGVNTLYLALGMLRWSEPDNGRRTLRAPLILLPVGLERRNARERFRLRYPGDDLETNLSLAEKLRRSFGVDLPELPDADDLDAEGLLRRRRRGDRRPGGLAGRARRGGARVLLVQSPADVPGPRRRPLARGVQARHAPDGREAARRRVRRGGRRPDDRRGRAARRAARPARRPAGPRRRRLADAGAGRRGRTAGRW